MADKTKNVKQGMEDEEYDADKLDKLYKNPLNLNEPTWDRMKGANEIGKRFIALQKELAKQQNYATYDKNWDQEFKKNYTKDPAIALQYAQNAQISRYKTKSHRKDILADQRLAAEKQIAKYSNKNSENNVLFNIEDINYGYKDKFQKLALNQYAQTIKDLENANFVVSAFGIYALKEGNNGVTKYAPVSQKKVLEKLGLKSIQTWQAKLEKTTVKKIFALIKIHKLNRNATAILNKIDKNKPFESKAKTWNLHKALLKFDTHPEDFHRTSEQFLQDINKGITEAKLPGISSVQDLINHYTAKFYMTDEQKKQAREAQKAAKNTFYNQLASTAVNNNLSTAELRALLTKQAQAK